MDIITTTYDGPDLDGYGCSMAYAELLSATGKKAEAHIWGTSHLEVQWLIQTFNLPEAKGAIDDVSSKVVFLDASEPKDLPKPLQIEQVIEIIDHRKIHRAEEFPNAKNQIELVGAAATLVAERFKKAGLEPSKESALYLLGGILSNTQNFTAIATDRDREMADWLWQISDAPKDLAKQMFLVKSDLSGDKLKQTLFGDLKTLHLAGKNVAIGQLEIIGVNELIESRLEEITTLLSKIHEQEQADFTFVNMKDLETGVATILCNDQETTDLLSAIPDTTWDGFIATSPTLTLRKQLSAWIQDRLQA